MTRYEEWLVGEKVPLGKSPFHRGYSSLGVDHDAIMAESVGAGRYDRDVAARHFAKMRPVRDEAIDRFAFAIPDEAALATIAAGGPVLECGAGTGYWAFELRERGADVVACDPHPYKDLNAEPGEPWTDVLPLTALEAAERHGAGRNLLLVWPSYDEPWAAEVLAVRPWPRVYYVGEWGGCTADDRFHDLLAELYDEEADLPVPTWDMVHDRLFVMKRKETRP